MSRIIFDCIDAHTCGNPVRVVKNGLPKLKGTSMSEYRQHFIREFDWIRTALMYEPRGHDMMSGSFILPPFDNKNDMAILFIETSGALPMCGHGTIGTVTIALEEGMVQPKNPGKLRIEVPAGLLDVDYELGNGKVEWVKFRNVKSYLAASDLEIECDELGKLIFDVAYGGNFYAIIDPQKNFVGIQEYSANELINMSYSLRKKMNEKYPNMFVHPEDSSIHSITHILWTGSPIHKNSDGRCAVFYGDKAIDRSPCGTGTSARMAQQFAKGKLAQGKAFVHESYIGSTFEGKIEEITQLNDLPAIIPSIKGWARIYGYNSIIVDDEDPFVHGFQVI